MKKILLENPFFSINTKNRFPEYFKNYNPSEIINWFGGHKDYFKVLSNISMGENFENISVPIKWHNQKLLRFLEKLTPSLKKIIPTLSENLESYLYPFSQLNNEELINHYSRLRNAFKDNLITLSRKHSEDRKKWLFRIDDIEIVFIWYGIGKKNSLKNEFEIIDRIKWISSLGNEIAFTFLCDYFLYRPDVALNNPCQSYLLEEYHKNRNIMALNALNLNKIPPDDFNTLSSYTDLTPCLSLAIQGSISAQDYLCKKCSNSAQMEEYSSILNFLLKSNYT